MCFFNDFFSFLEFLFSLFDPNVSDLCFPDVVFSLLKFLLSLLNFDLPILEFSAIAILLLVVSAFLLEDLDLGFKPADFLSGFEGVWWGCWNTRDGELAESFFYFLFYF